MKRPIDITAAQHKTLLALLERYLPDAAAWVYGSRVKWTSRPQSDLDLVVFAAPEQERRVSDLREAFEESSLPFRVDLFVWDDVPEQFRKQIEAEHVVLAEKPAAQANANWREVCWGDIATLEYGRALRGYDDAQGSFRVFGTNGPIGWHDEALCQYASVIVGRKGAYRGIHYSADPFFVIDTAFYLKPKAEMDVRWAYYALLTQGINEMDSGSAIPSTSREEFYGLPVRVPPLPEQRAIAHILGALDDKIELNRRMNETLEAMARALFKSWFANFEPVRAKMEGRDTGLPQEIADLFPDRMVESEMGKIPEGWGVGTVSQLAERTQNGGTPKRSEPTYWERGEIPWLTSGEVRQSFILGTQNFISEEGLAKSSAKMVPARSILVALYGATAGQVSMNYQPLSTNQAISAVIPSTGNRYFCLISLKLEVSELENRAVGSAQQNISKKIVEDTIVLLPHIELRSAYDALVEPLFDRNFHNLDENQTLATLRDALLPKLVSGGLRVGDGEGRL